MRKGRLASFKKGLLRESTVLRHKGSIMASKGRKIDAFLLDEDDPVRKKTVA